MLISSRVIGEADAKARIGWEMWPRNLDTPPMRRTVRGVKRRESLLNVGSPNVCPSQPHALEVGLGGMK